MTGIAFGAPAFLWLLAAPAVLLAIWLVRVARRRADLRRWSRRRTTPIRERFSLTGDLTFWLCQIVALALMIVAVARPLAPSSLPRLAGLDIVVLQDASASMRVSDVAHVSAPTGAGAKPS